MTEEIKNCPMCDGKCYFIDHGVSSYWGYIECRCCLLSSPYFDNYYEAIKYWNKRV